VKRKAWIFDIDGTLVNVEHRMHLIKPPEGVKKNWPGFFSACKDDTPYEHTVRLCHLIGEKEKDKDAISLVTARPYNYVDQTVSQMAALGVRWDALCMRPKGEHKPDYEVKRDIYRTLIKPNYDVVAAFEDRLQVAKMWREEGVPVFLCGDEWLTT
jgi:phosphoglycolate phosphatase-like HAD superfamily hydrolase